MGDLRISMGDISGRCWEFDCPKISLNGVLRDSCEGSYGNLVGTREMSYPRHDGYVTSGILIGMCVDNLTRMPC
jgi:hypothetical protein